MTPTLIGIGGMLIAFALFIYAIRRKDILVFVVSTLMAFAAFFIFFKGVYLLYVPVFS